MFPHIFCLHSTSPGIIICIIHIIRLLVVLLITIKRCSGTLRLDTFLLKRGHQAIQNIQYNKHFAGLYLCSNSMKRNHRLVLLLLLCILFYSIMIVISPFLIVVIIKEAFCPPFFCCCAIYGEGGKQCDGNIIKK